MPKKVAVKLTLSPKEMAQAIGVSESSLRRWADAGRLRFDLTPGGHRRISRQEAWRFIQDNSLTISDSKILGLPPALIRDNPPQSAGNTSNLVEQMTEHLVQGETQAVVDMLLSARTQGQTLAWAVDQYIQPAMKTIGTLWLNQEDGILREHTASHTLNTTIVQLRALATPPADSAPCALGGALEHDAHGLPGLSAGLAIEEAGWRSIELGPLTPAQSYIQAIEQHKPQLVWITLGHGHNNMFYDLRQIQLATLNAQATFWIGGRLATDVATNLPGVCVKTSLTEIQNDLPQLAAENSKSNAA